MFNVFFVPLQSQMNKTNKTTYLNKANIIKPRDV